MPKKCGCAQGICSCKFQNSSDVTWSGSGTKSDPFLATAKPLLIADDTATLALDLQEGDDVLTLSAQPLIAAYVDVFTSDDTWVKPTGVTFARVLMIAGGGGGASGSFNSATAGGGGGDAGQVVNFMLAGGGIPASAAIEVGQGGLGGAAPVAGTGAAGSDGGHTKFDDRLVRGGVGGQPLGLAGNHLSQGNPPGQWAVDWDATWTPAHYYLAPGAGGCGGGNTFDPQPGGYSQPGQGSRFPSNTGGGAVGEDGRDEPVTKMGGGGGGGDTAETGGDGGLYGGGGGGGGTRGSSSSPGAGGKGANGILVVVSW
jgi:hypothetical protein